jgi:exonuclease III
MDTLGVKFGAGAIDHIYASASLAPSLQVARVVRNDGFRKEHDAPAGSWAHSDHLPVVADFDVPWVSDSASLEAVTSAPK